MFALATAAMGEVAEDISKELPGFLPCLGGTELLQATQALFGNTAPLQQAEGSDRLTGSKPHRPAALQHLTQETEEDVHIRDLLHSINRFALLAERRPPSFDDKYHYGLLLQELAAKLRYDLEMQSRVMPRTHVIELLMLASEKYEEALQIRPKFHAALYNWGVALSELSSLWKATDSYRALYFLHLASQKYSESLEECHNNPRGLNNWGLVLQEVSNYETDPTKRIQLAIQSIDKFRNSVRFQLDFDHGCYNLGTIYYTHAAHIRDSVHDPEQPQYVDAQGALVEPLRQLSGEDKGLEEAANVMMQSAAQYICLAAALQPTSSVYQGSVEIVKHMLPRPFLRVGHLKVARFLSLGAVKESWERQWFALDSTRLASGIGRQYLRGGSYVPPKNREKEEPGPENYNVPIKDIVAIDRCMELALPEGSGFWIQTHRYPQGLYFLSENAEAAEAWVDCLKLCHHLVALNKVQALNEILGS